MNGGLDVPDNFFDSFSTVDDISDTCKAKELEQLPVSFLDAALAHVSGHELEPPGTLTMAGEPPMPAPLPVVMPQPTSANILGSLSIKVPDAALGATSNPQPKATVSKVLPAPIKIVGTKDMDSAPSMAVGWEGSAKHCPTVAKDTADCGKGSEIPLDLVVTNFVLCVAGQDDSTAKDPTLGGKTSTPIVYKDRFACIGSKGAHASIKGESVYSESNSKASISHYVILGLLVG